MHKVYKHTKSVNKQNKYKLLQTCTQRYQTYTKHYQTYTKHTKVHEAFTNVYKAFTTMHKELLVKDFIEQQQHGLSDSTGG